MVFINKRGIFKMGRTWSEMIEKDRSNPSAFSWISRYGSVTFNVFGRDFPDGGMNEVGLYIWEMNEDAEYPQDESLPRLDQMQWMQFILDSYSTVDEAIQCASEIEISGWGWHYFVGDARGDCAAIAFIDGRPKVNRGPTMPVPGLFNTPYDRELELLRYYKGFGGLYEPDLDDCKVPRFVKTAVMTRDYDPAQDAVEYGFQMLSNLMVYDVPEWSVIVDEGRRDVYFRTRLNPEIKHISMDDIDFINNPNALILNMDVAEGGDAMARFQPYSNERIRDFMDSFVVPILPEEFFTGGGLTLEEYLDRFSTHTDAAAFEKNQFFKGTWKTENQGAEDDWELTVSLNTEKDAVTGEISFSPDADDSFEIEHLQLIGNLLTFTFKAGVRHQLVPELVEVQAIIEDGRMEIDLFDIENYLRSAVLAK